MSDAFWFNENAFSNGPESTADPSQGPRPDDVSSAAGLRHSEDDFFNTLFTDDVLANVPANEQPRPSPNPESQFNARPSDTSALIAQSPGDPHLNSTDPVSKMRQQIMQQQILQQRQQAMLLARPDLAHSQAAPTPGSIQPGQGFSGSSMPFLTDLDPQDNNLRHQKQTAPPRQIAEHNHLQNQQAFYQQNQQSMKEPRSSLHGTMQPNFQGNQMPISASDQGLPGNMPMSSNQSINQNSSVNPYQFQGNHVQHSMPMNQYQPPNSNQAKAGHRQNQAQNLAGPPPSSYSQAQLPASYQTIAFQSQDRNLQQDPRSLAQQAAQTHQNMPQKTGSNSAVQVQNQNLQAQLQSQMPLNPQLQAQNQLLSQNQQPSQAMHGGAQTENQAYANLPGPSALQPMGARPPPNQIASIQTELFFSVLYDFMERRGSPITTPPTVNNRRVNLLGFHLMTQQMGGPQFLVKYAQKPPGSSPQQPSPWLQIGHRLGLLEGLNIDDLLARENIERLISNCYAQYLYAYEQYNNTEEGFKELLARKAIFQKRLALRLQQKQLQQQQQKQLQQQQQLQIEHAALPVFAHGGQASAQNPDKMHPQSRTSDNPQAHGQMGLANNSLQMSLQQLSPRLTHSSTMPPGMTGMAVSSPGQNGLPAAPVTAYSNQNTPRLGNAARPDAVSGNPSPAMSASNISPNTPLGARQRTQIPQLVQMKASAIYRAQQQGQHAQYSQINPNPLQGPQFVQGMLPSTPGFPQLTLLDGQYTHQSVQPGQPRQELQLQLVPPIAARRGATPKDLLAPIADAPGIIKNYVPHRHVIDTYGGYSLKELYAIGGEIEVTKPVYLFAPELGAINLHALVMALKNYTTPHLGEVTTALNTLLVSTSDVNYSFKIQDCMELIDALCLLGLKLLRNIEGKPTDDFEDNADAAFTNDRINDIFKKYATPEYQHGEDIELVVDSLSGQVQGSDCIDEIFPMPTPSSPPSAMDLDDEGPPTSFAILNYASRLQEFQRENKYHFSTIQTRSANDQQILLVDLLITITMILRNVSFAEINRQHVAENSCFREFLFSVIESVGLYPEQYTLHRKTLCVLKDCLLTLNNVAYYLDLRTLKDAFLVYVLVSLFGVDMSKDDWKIEPSSLDIHKSLSYGIDAFTKIIVKEPYNRLLMRAVLTGTLHINATPTYSNVTPLEISEDDQAETRILMTKYLGTSDLRSGILWNRLVRLMFGIFPFDVTSYDFSKFIFLRAPTVLQALFGAKILLDMVDQDETLSSLPARFLAENKQELLRNLGRLTFALVPETSKFPPPSNEFQILTLVLSKVLIVLNTLLAYSVEECSRTPNPAFAQTLHDLATLANALPDDVNVIDTFLSPKVDAQLSLEIVRYHTLLRQLSPSSDV